MTDFRDMELLVALARNKHFARAADVCGISQPAFSARIRNLEMALGIPIVKRGNRFMGFTNEGEIALKWATMITRNLDGLHQEIGAAQGALSGRITLGVVPTALAFSAEISYHLSIEFPKLSVDILSLSSSKIVRGLDDFSLDAGITYQDDERLAALQVTALYDESYVLLAPEHLAPRPTGTCRWDEAAALPLCLLSQDMRNRQIIDEAFRSVGFAPVPVMETNAFTAVLAHVACGMAATIAPKKLAENLSMGQQVIQLSLSDPEVTQPICLATAIQEPKIPSISALISAVSQFARAKEI